IISKDHNINLASGEVSEVEKSFFEIRMQQLGVTPEVNGINAFLPDQFMPREKPLFSEDEHGNIKIWYYDLKDHIVTYNTDAKTNPERHFFRIRFKNPKADIDGK